jgi:hypothetical protein
LWRRFIGSTGERDEGVSAVPADTAVRAEHSSNVNEEPLARFIPERGHKSRISTQKCEAKPSAFLPMWNDVRGRFETSTFRIGGLDEGSVWRLAEQHVEPTQGRVIASAIVQGSGVFDAGLDIDPDDVPPRHACIIGWPEEKEARKEHALLLREMSHLEMR